MVTKETKRKKCSCTIRISCTTKKLLDDLKMHPSESYDEVLGRMLTRVK